MGVVVVSLLLLEIEFECAVSDKAGFIVKRFRKQSV